MYTLYTLYTFGYYLTFRRGYTLWIARHSATIWRCTMDCFGDIFNTHWRLSSTQDPSEKNTHKYSYDSRMCRWACWVMCLWFLASYQLICRSLILSSECALHCRCVPAVCRAKYLFKLFWLRTPILLRHSWRTPTLVAVKFTAKYSNSWAHCFLQTNKHYQLYTILQITMEGKQC